MSTVFPNRIYRINFPELYFFISMNYLSQFLSNSHIFLQWYSPHKSESVKNMDRISPICICQLGWFEEICSDSQCSNNGREKHMSKVNGVLQCNAMQCHTSYLSLLSHNRNFEVRKFYTWKCVNSRQSYLAAKQRKVTSGSLNSRVFIYVWNYTLCVKLCTV